MSLQTHLAELERKHRTIDTAISHELQHANSDETKVNELKRRKLQLKDEITKLKQSLETKTIH